MLLISHGGAHLDPQCGVGGVRMSQRRLGRRPESVPSAHLSPPLLGVTHSFTGSGLWRPRGSGGGGGHPIIPPLLTPAHRVPTAGQVVCRNQISASLRPNPSGMKSLGSKAYFHPVHSSLGPARPLHPCLPPMLSPQRRPEGAREHLRQLPPSSVHSPPGLPPPSSKSPSSPRGSQGPA